MNETQTISRRGRFQKLDGFVLKIIALLTMTLDHVAVAIESVLPTYGYLIVEGGALYNIVLAFHIIGRLSFPIFIFLLAEGLHHTHSRSVYLLRLAVAWTFVLVMSLILQFGFGFRVISQAFSDLLAYALFIYLIELKKKPLRFLSLLPLAYIGVSYAIRYMGIIDVAYEPYQLFIGGYSIYGFAIFLLFYYGPKILDFLILKTSSFTKGETFDAFKETPDYRYLSNLYSCLVLVLMTVLFWALLSLGAEGLFEQGPYDVYAMGIQSYCVLAAVPIACYNGKRGYNAKWFQYGSYAYYPLHLALVFGITILIASLVL